MSALTAIVSENQLVFDINLGIYKISRSAVIRTRNASEAVLFKNQLISPQRPNIRTECVLSPYSKTHLLQ
jgi:hypothetical protein